VTSNQPTDEFDWSRFDALTDEEVLAAALADPDAQPLTAEDLRRMKPVAKTRIIRHRLKLSQEAFSQRFRIPIGTLRDWEQGRRTPSPAAQAYLTVIARDPEAVTRALDPIA
jgi:putative transcriptional regulator